MNVKSRRQTRPACPWSVAQVLDEHFWPEA